MTYNEKFLQLKAEAEVKSDTYARAAGTNAGRRLVEWDKAEKEVSDFLNSMKIGGLLLTDRIPA